MKKAKNEAVRRPTSEEMADAFANLCERCPTGWRVVGDTLCAACRAEVDAVYCDLPGARA